MSTTWIRFVVDGDSRFGTLDDGRIAVHDGDVFAGPRPTGETIALADVGLLPPTVPAKIVGLWNNSRALAAKLDVPIPSEPLYFLNSTTSVIASGDPIRRPASYDGKVTFEGELGVVIGRPCRAVSEADAPRFVFGYTCVNDVTAIELIARDPAFPQWARAKSFDTFCPLGPVVVGGLDPTTLTVRTIVNGKVRQEYPVTDMAFSPARLVSLISADMTLLPGDVIACGTATGVGSMRPGDTVEVDIEGIGVLTNDYA